MRREMKALEAEIAILRREGKAGIERALRVELKAAEGETRDAMREIAALRQELQARTSPERRRFEALEEENERLRQEIRRMELMLETPEPLPDTHLTPQQMAIWRVLGKHGRGSHEQLQAAVRHHSPNTKGFQSGNELLKVHVHLMRKKGMAIESIWGWGYALKKADAPAAA